MALTPGAPQPAPLAATAEATRKHNETPPAQTEREGSYGGADQLHLTVVRFTVMSP